MKSSGSFKSSYSYWIKRYESGGNSGIGSYGDLAKFKAKIINNFVYGNKIKSIIEYGVGDGNQLKLAKYPYYLGFDISSKALSICKDLFSNDNAKFFKLIKDYENETAELTISLDVIYHLIEDNIFSEYMHRLYDSSQKFVIIYSSDTDENAENQAKHIKHRKFTKWVLYNKPEWKLAKYIPNNYPFNANTNTGSFADFFIFKRIEDD